MRAIPLLLSLAAGMIFAVASADAAQWKFNVFMDGLQEAPTPVATPGTGSAMVLFDSVTGQMDVSGTFNDLLANANNAHVHGYAPVGTPAGVVFGLSFTASTDGTVSGSGTIPAARIADVLSGLTYINIHSQLHPGGEIRGQIAGPIFIPEPASVALLSLGVAGLFSLRRRSR